ncbi:MAG: DUF459 domain-containing protein [Aquamicrobium sp.]|uniref:SGNH/GDSL hydrolase family protein n=1 Tax=Aquamicrobium sp. TaxID=1872579 RepID=UPI00349EBAAD|nr:DUF459 domain-containing protein [Aquamicrobium sp.]
MKAFTAPLGHFGRIVCAGLLLALAMPSPGGGFGPAGAHAQESGERRGGGGLLRFLFPRSEKRDRAAPVETKPRRPAQRRTAPAAQQPAVPTVAKAEDARRVLVIGDFLAGGLADGLASAYAENANVLVVGRSNGSSGLVRDDHYDWPGNIASVVEAENPAAVVVMIGSNDRQQMRVGDTRETPRSDAWTAEYERRATALVKAIRDRNLPLLWVGNLPFKSSAMSSDMVAFNDIYRRIVTDAGGEFIDVWDGFVDEGGNFVANGPDMNGQPAQLRAEDGINVTRAGRRKMAFYVEKPLARLLDLRDAGRPDSLAPEPGLVPGPDGVPAEIDRTPPLAIDDLGAEAGSGLLGAVVAPPNGEAKTPAEKLAREGIAPETRPGRADDFVARRPEAVVPAAAAAPAPETTGALTR